MAIGTGTAIGLGISALGSWLGGRKSKKEKEALAAQRDNIRLQTEMARTMGDFAKQQHSMADPALQKAMQYYTNIASGNRSAIQGALAPTYAQMGDLYRGAEQGMTKNMAPGPQRESAMAEMYRQKAGQMGQLPFQARTDAMGKLGEYGSAGFDRMLGAYTGASGAGGQAALGAAQYANLARQSRPNWGQFGADVGKIFLPYLTGMGGASTAPYPGQKV